VTLKPALAWLALELAGITLVCWGVAQWSVGAAVIVGGVALVAEAAKLS